MKIKNVSKKTFNLVSGTCKPGAVGEVTFEEAKLLLGQGFAEVSVDKPKPAPKPKAPVNG